jgi:hypothetical protein
VLGLGYCRRSSDVHLLKPVLQHKHVH